jgi:hypothetical protein
MAEDILSQDDAMAYTVLSFLAFEMSCAIHGILPVSIQSEEMMYRRADLDVIRIKKDVSATVRMEKKEE